MKDCRQNMHVKGTSAVLKKKNQAEIENNQCY
jgi:hypothetical protein